jgi:hypothetical protein
LRLRPPVLAELARHGIEPGAATPAELKDRLHAAYLREVRELRERRRRGDLPGSAFAEAVGRLEERYPLLGVSSSMWTE